MSPPSLVRLPVPLAHWLSSGGLHNPTSALSSLCTHARRHSRTRLACQLRREEMGKRGLKTLARARAQLVGARVVDRGRRRRRKKGEHFRLPASSFLDRRQEGERMKVAEISVASWRFNCPLILFLGLFSRWMDVGDLEVEGNYFCRILFHCLPHTCFNKSPRRFVVPI